MSHRTGRADLDVSVSFRRGCRPDRRARRIAARSSARVATTIRRTMAPMLVMRRDQMTAFSRSRMDDFEERMAVHLSRFFPHASAALGERGLRDAIRGG